MARIEIYPQAIFNLKGSGAKAAMSVSEHHFIAFLLRKYQPRKILEVGVSAGGTSVHILKNTGDGQTLHSVDIGKIMWGAEERPFGWQVAKFCTTQEIARHNLYLGKDVVECIEDIGYDIDFCILDTTHDLPGELLQFFAIMPFMRTNCVLILHDLALNFLWPIKGHSLEEMRSMIATRALFCALYSDTKMLPNLPNPNIGALLVDKSTRKHIESTFLALGLSWTYLPSEELLQKYLYFFQKYYSGFLATQFNEIIKLQRTISTN